MLQIQVYDELLPAGVSADDVLTAIRVRDDGHDALVQQIEALQAQCDDYRETMRVAVDAQAFCATTVAAVRHVVGAMLSISDAQPTMPLEDFKPWLDDLRRAVWPERTTSDEVPSANDPG